MTLSIFLYPPAKHIGPNEFHHSVFFQSTTRTIKASFFFQIHQRSTEKVGFSPEDSKNDTRLKMLALTDDDILSDYNHWGRHSIRIVPKKNMEELEEQFGAIHADFHSSRLIREKNPSTKE